MFRSRGLETVGRGKLYLFDIPAGTEALDRL
jgi:hypothetical protein